MVKKSYSRVTRQCGSRPERGKRKNFSLKICDIMKEKATVKVVFVIFEN